MESTQYTRWTIHDHELDPNPTPKKCMQFFQHNLINDFRDSIEYLPQLMNTCLNGYNYVEMYVQINFKRKCLALSLFYSSSF